jgi:N-6 DNA Methylase
MLNTIVVNMQDLIHKKYLQEFSSKHTINPTKINNLKSFFVKTKNSIIKNDFGNESQMKQLFLNELFTLLGYDFGDSFYFEVKTITGSKEMDGTLGADASNNDNAEVAIEWKGLNTKDLDSESKSKKSAVTQLFDYMSRTNAEFGIVSNFVEYRLYNYNSRQQKVNTFFLDDLIINKNEALDNFYILFAKEFLLKGDKPSSIISNYVKKSDEIQEDISKEFYKKYSSCRLNLYEHITAVNETVNPEVALEKSQKILDRLIFIYFCEDSFDLLPDDISNLTYLAGKKSRRRDNQRIWSEYKALFEDIDKGRVEGSFTINEYNGGLFAYDSILDNLIIEDKIWDKINELGRYDFKSDLNINILGHIFEQSISDIERVKKELKGEVLEKSKSKQKKDGIYYTPTFITEYITNTCLDEYLKNGGVLENVKILDPACGSGAFLNQAYDSLFKKLNVLQNSDFMSETKIKDLASSILNNNLYGVDLQAESVEIAKLSLWLKTARSDRKLQNLDQNIKQGDSLIEFNWDQEFSTIKAEGGFDIIIGNPPYVRHELIPKEVKHSIFNSYPNVGELTADLYIYFIQKAINLLKNGGVMGFILPNNWMERKYGNKLRKYIKQYEISKIINFGELKIFENVSVDSCILILRKTISDKNIDYSQLKNLDSFINNKEIEFVNFEKSKLTDSIWSFKLNDKMINTSNFVTLKEYTKDGLRYGVKTGANSIFIIDKSIKTKIIEEDP